MRALKASRSPMKFSANTGNPDASLEIKGSLTLFAQDGHLLMRAQGQANSLARAQLRKDLADIWILANTRLDVAACLSKQLVRLVGSHSRARRSVLSCRTEKRIKVVITSLQTRLIDKEVDSSSRVFKRIHADRRPLRRDLKTYE